MVVRKNKMKGKEILSNEDFNQCIKFHGHVCPGLAIGFRAAQVLMKQLGVGKAPDEELVAMVETDACGSDAIQVMTGCTFGKGNFIFKNYGKHAFSLMDRKRGRGIRVCLRPNIFKNDSELLSLFERVQNNEASPIEMERFGKIQMEKTQKILDADSDSLFNIEEIFPEIPAKARVIESGICDLCGEPTKRDLLLQREGKQICVLCDQKTK
jgi:formylmethanofuran dehydrogenase subunit E